MGSFISWKIVIVLIMSDGTQNILSPSVSFETEQECDIALVMSSDLIVRFSQNTKIDKSSVYCAETRSL